MTTTDHMHLQAIRTGDSAGLREIFRLYLPRVAGLVTRNGGTYDDARDIFQDALVVLFEKSRSGQFELRSAFPTLLYGICRNLWGNRLQKKSRTEVTLTDDFKLTDTVDLERDLLEAEENRIFWDGFRRLGADCQQLLRLFFEQKKMEEIAAAMQFGSVSYAKKRKFQCKEYLIGLIRADLKDQNAL
jgi:RNA polymerase sigma factor (sigma-70 family)